VECHLGNVPVKDVTIQMVEQTYAAIPQNDHAAATMLGNLLNGKQEEDEPKDPQENAAQTQEESFRLLPHENLPKVTAKSRQKARRGHTKTGQLVQLVS